MFSMHCNAVSSIYRSPLLFSLEDASSPTLRIGACLSHNIPEAGRNLGRGAEEIPKETGNYVPSLTQDKTERMQWMIRRGMWRNPTPRCPGVTFCGRRGTASEQSPSPSCCKGGVSHVDTFDYKPELEKSDGKEMAGKGQIETFFGQPGRLMKSPFRFARRGQSGLWASDLLPHLAGCVDDMTFLYSMTAKSSNHTPATFFMNSGFTMNGFPCLGSWLSYGLGAENQNLPAFVVLPDPRGVPAGGAINW